jgi:integrase
MDYHAFRKPKKLKNGKMVHRWYYYYLDENKKQVQKACPGCKNRKEAENYIRTLPGANAKDGCILIRDICAGMFLLGGAHMNRRAQLGRNIDTHTIEEGRRHITAIAARWGHLTLPEVDPTSVTKYLFTLNRSGSWKNRYISMFREIYRESQWHECRTPMPQFQNFAKNTKKADILSTAEISRLFIQENFPSYDFYLFFLFCLSAGLRLGEVRAVRPKQLLFERKAFIVDGFCKQNGTRTNYNKAGTPDNPRFRVVILSDMVLGLMKEYIAAQGITPDDFIFKYNGHPVRQSHAESVFGSALVKAGIAIGKAAYKKTSQYDPAKRVPKSNIIPDGRRLVVHSLRFTYVTRMRRELPGETVMKMAGHANIAQTDYYTDRQALEEALAGIAGADAATANFFN